MPHGTISANTSAESHENAKFVPMGMSQNGRKLGGSYWPLEVRGRTVSSLNADTPMRAEVIPPKVLPRVLSRVDLTAIYFAIVFGSYGAAQMASLGWASIPMLLLASVTFLIPCAVAAYELGTLFPGEGGIYIWAHKIFGPIHGFIAGWLSWVPIFLLIPLDVVTIVAHLQAAFSTTWPLWIQVALQLGIIWFVVCIATLTLKASQAYVRTLCYVSFGTAVVIFVVAMLRHTPATPISSDIVSFDLRKHGAAFAAAILWLLGVEVPFNMSAEFSHHKKTAGTMILWGSCALLVAYVFGIIGVLYTTPVAEVNSVTGVALGVGRVFPILGSVLSLTICVVVSSQSVNYMNAYSRLLFVSGIEKRLPAAFARVSANRVPATAMLTQAVGASIVVLIFSSQTHLAIAFNIYLAALTTVWCASLFYIYFGVVRARETYKAAYEARHDDVWRIPGGAFGLWSVAAVGALFNGLAIYYVFALPWVSGITPAAWRTWLGSISVVVIMLGAAIFFASKDRVAPLSSDDNDEVGHAL